MQEVVTFLARRKKAIVALGVLIGLVGTAVSDGVITTDEWWQIAIAAGGVVGVHQVTNES